MLSVILYVVMIVADWKVYEKMGRQGWECIIPFYNVYVLFQVLYGNGWKMLLLLSPFYNIYVAIKLQIDLAHGFNQFGAFVLG